MKPYNKQLKEAFDPDNFKEMALVCADMLSTYLKQCLARECESVLPDISPDSMLNRWQAQIPEKPTSHVMELVARTIEDSNHLHHPGYIGHQVTSPLPLSAVCEFAGALLNNATAVYEMGPVNTILEKRLIQWMSELIGYDTSADGVFTSGGTLGNLTGLLAARQVKADYDIWAEGVDRDKRHAVLVSEHSHYSVKRAVAVMGLGEEAAIPVPVDDLYHMDLEALDYVYRRCIQEGRDVIAVAANACSTATGSFDDLNRIADFCLDHDLWLHVDGAHGASALLSEEYRPLLRGIERADSVVWDAHKMLLMPALITAVIFKNGAHSYRSFAQKASYLFEKESHDEWYNYAHRTMECTKTMMGLRLYIPLLVYGTDFFGNYVTSRINLAKEFAELIDSTGDFECGLEPECNIVCFRYRPQNALNLDELQKNLRRNVLESERFYIVQTQLKDGFYLRCTIINPLTTIDDLKGLLDLIRNAAAQYADSSKQKE